MLAQLRLGDGRCLVMGNECQELIAVASIQTNQKLALIVTVKFIALLSRNVY